MSTGPIEPTVHTRPVFMLLLSLLLSAARHVLWTCVGALAARPLRPMAQPIPIRADRIPRRTTGRLRDGT
jgi:hypothetical protein